MSTKRWSIALVALALTAHGAVAQEETARDSMAQDSMAQDTVPAAMEVASQRPIPAGVYTFVPEESDEIGPRAREAVSHLFFAIRGIARRRLEGANEPIDRVDLAYAGDTILVSLREDEPTYRALMSGDSLPYTREDGEVIQVSAETAPGVIDMYFVAEDGMKEMIFQMREDGHLAVESITYSDKLEEPFRYTWVYAPTEGM